MSIFRSIDKPKNSTANDPFSDDGLVTKKKPVDVEKPRQSIHDMEHDATIIDFDGELSISDDPGSDPYGC